jgi:methanogenic corrinoid protein MtbC1
MLEELTTKMGDLEEQDVLALVKKELDAGTDPLAILEAGRQGMGIVGKRFEEKEYFVAELMMAAAVFKEVAALVAPKIKAGTAGPSKGIVIFGTVQGDIHDIGKNIVVSMLQANGYDVRDQGVDVPAGKFIAALKETGAKVLGMSGLVTVSYDGMKAVIQALQDAGLRDRVKVMIGGGIINEKVREYTGADAWGKDANQAVTICGQLMGGK